MRTRCPYCNSEVESEFPGIDWTAWGSAQERAFATEFFNNVEGITADMTNGGDEDVTPDASDGFARWEVTYYLRVTDQFGQETRYRARATLEIRLEGTFYYIDRWIDMRQESDPDSGADLPTMGRLRGTFASKNFQGVIQ